jgi:hypothetical protein
MTARGMSKRMIVAAAALALLGCLAGCGSATTSLGRGTTSPPCGLEGEGSSAGPCVWTPAQAAAAEQEVLRALRADQPQGQATEKSHAQIEKEQEASSGMSYQNICKLNHDCSAEEQ